MDKYSFLNAASTAFFGELYDKYCENPDAVEASWRAFFQGFDFAQEEYGAGSDTHEDRTPAEPLFRSWYRSCTRVLCPHNRLLPHKQWWLPPRR